MGKTTVSRLAGFLLAGALLAVGTGCSATSDQDYAPESVAQACQIMTEELSATGTSLAELKQTDPATMDAAGMAEQYNVTGAALDRAAGRASDEQVREILSMAGAAMAEMSPLFDAVATGDQAALKQVKEPLKQLAVVTERCGA